MGFRWRLILAFGAVILTAQGASWYAAEHTTRSVASETAASRVRLLELDAATHLETLAQRETCDLAPVLAALDLAHRESGLSWREISGQEPRGRRDRRAWSAAREALALATRESRCTAVVVIDLRGAVAARLHGESAPASIDVPRGGLLDGGSYWAAASGDALVRRTVALLPAGEGEVARRHALVGERVVLLADLSAALAAGLGSNAALVEAARTLPGAIGPSPSDGTAAAAVRGAAGERLAVVLVRPREAGEALRIATSRALAAGAIAGGAAALILALLMGHLLSAPLVRLRDAVDAITEEGARATPMPRAPGDPGRLADAIDRMLARLEAQGLARRAAERAATWRDVARRVAHEVKNPLTPIRLAVDNLRRAASRGPEALQGALDAESTAIAVEVARLDRLVREFAEYARLPAPNPRPTDLAALAGEALRGQIGDAAGIVCNVVVAPGTPRAMADPELVGAVLQNLVRNAVEALDGREGRIVATCGPAGAGDVEVVLEDNGPGIPEELLPRLFEPYVTGRGAAGTGLGLAIAHRVAVEHGGSISAENVPGGGARFRLVLPASSTAPGS